jgi:hypothetical protein
MGGTTRGDGASHRRTTASAGVTSSSKAAGWLLSLLFVLHHDVWLWDAPHRVTWAAGLPAGFLYHVGYCLLAAGAMALLARRAWPRGLDEEGR